MTEKNFLNEICHHLTEIFFSSLLNYHKFIPEDNSLVKIIKLACPKMIECRKNFD